MTDKIIDDIEELFDISTSKNRSEDNQSGGKPDFTELLNDVSGELEGHDTLELKVTMKKWQDVTKGEDEEKSNIEVEEKDDSSVEIDNVFGSLSESNDKEEIKDLEKEKNTSNRQDTERSPNKDLEDLPKSQDASEEYLLETKSSESKKDMLVDDEQIKWIVKSPSEKYDRFYEKKRSSLLDLLPGGQIPYRKYLDELKEARVNLNSDSYDTRDIYDRMCSVQMWRERVQEIAMHCNEQYYMWDRFIELFRGVLARTEYEKPALRQDGIVFQHMRDMELYHSRLHSLHVSIAQVLRNLESAFECLSRQVTISLQGKEPNRRAAKTEDHQEQVVRTEDNIVDNIVDNEEFKGFDSLRDSKKTEPKKKGSQLQDWDDLG